MSVLRSQRVVAEKDRDDVFPGWVAVFKKKKKLKSEIFNDKNGLQTKIFLLINKKNLILCSLRI